MSDAVTANVVRSDKYNYIVHLTNISDGSGEAAVAKVNKSDLTAQDGAEPASVNIEYVRWDVQGFTEVRLLWDHTVDDVGMILSGSGYEDFTFRNQLVWVRSTSGLPDPRSSGGTGDIVLTTTGALAGDTYDITLAVRLMND